MKVFITTTIFILFLVIAGLNSQGQVFPAHAHNDYRHDRPLFDALDCKFKSIEVDVFEIGDSLFVAHDFEDIKPGWTIRKLYLDPLKQVIAKNDGSVYGCGEEVILVVDFKSEGLKTYKLLHRILEDYKELLTFYKNGKLEKGAVQVIISGNRPLDYMKQQDVRYAFYDGRISDLDSGISSELMPLVSDNWRNHFKWYGKGEMPADEKEKLKTIIKKANKNGYLIRFWGTFERPGEIRSNLWNELKNAGTGLIGTDDLKGLQDFFKN